MIFKGRRVDDAGRAPEPSVPARSLLRRIFGLFRPYRFQVTLLLAAVAVAAAIGIATPLVTKVVFDRALFPPSGDPQLELLSWLVALMIALVLLGGAVAIGQTYLSTRVGQRVMHDLRFRLYEHLQGMSLRFFTSARTGEVQSRIANDVGGVGHVVTDSGPSILMNVAVAISSVIAMSLLSWQLTLISVAMLLPFALLVRRVGRMSRRLSSDTQQTLAEMSVITQETLSVSGALQTKLFDGHRNASARYRDQSERLAALRIRQEMLVRALTGVAQTFFIVVPALLYLASGHLLVAGADLTAGTLVAFTALQMRLYTPFRYVMGTWIEVVSSFALFERIFEYADLDHEIVDRPGAVRLEKERVAGAITFDDVSFRYSRGDTTPPPVVANPSGNGSTRGRTWALEHVSLEIEPGQLAALVGPSGAGKTTLAQLIPRLHDVQDGSVRIDGLDVRDIELASLATIVGLVTQEPHLFHASVAENLRLARPDASPDELEAAARTAHIHERICELEHGYETVVGERGYHLSGGEKQRLAIARVILRDPKILILDEATSSLDTMSERLVQAALEPLLPQRTTLAIAHRLSTILSADVIFFMDRGQHRRARTPRGARVERWSLCRALRAAVSARPRGGPLPGRCRAGERRGGELRARRPTVDEPGPGLAG